MWWWGVWKLGDGCISLNNAVPFWNDDRGNTRDLLSFDSFKMFIKWLKTKENNSYENDHSGESNSNKSLKTFVEEKRMELKEKEKHQVELPLKGKDAQRGF